MGLFLQWIRGLDRRPPRFQDWEEFSAYFKEIEDGLVEAALPDAAQELQSHLKAGEVPVTGYYVRVAGVLENILRQHQDRLPSPLARKLREAISKLVRTANLG